MKANAPERIYLQKYDYDTLLCLNKWNIHEEWTVKPCNEKIATNIEYTRTDASIEKACDAYCKVCGHYAHTTPTHICRHACDYFKDFKQAMKDE